MFLIYLDESGNTGLNLNDPEQPIFVLCALAVAKERWQSLENSLREILINKCPLWQSTDKFEIHAADLRAGRAHFKGMSTTDRVALRDAWMRAGIEHDAKLFYRSINKIQYANWLNGIMGRGIVVHPYVTAFALLSRSIDNYLGSLGKNTMGILIADENKEIVSDIEKSISLLKETVGPLKLSRFLEKGFFIESHKSLPLQLCDLFALSVRKYVEIHKCDKSPASFDRTGIDLALSIVQRDNQHDHDVLKWLVDHAHKNSGQGFKPKVD